MQITILHKWKKQFQLLFKEMRFETATNCHCFPVKLAKINASQSVVSGGAWGEASSGAGEKREGLVSLEGAWRPHQQLLWPSQSCVTAWKCPTCPHRCPSQEALFVTRRRTWYRCGCFENQKQENGERPPPVVLMAAVEQRWKRRWGGRAPLPSPPLPSLGWPSVTYISQWRRNWCHLKMFINLEITWERAW